MQGRTHKALSLDVLVSELPPMFHPWAEKVAENADLPDRVEDTKVGRFGTKLAGHIVSACAHFCVYTIGGHFRGYCWSSDRSLWRCIRRLDPRVGDVACITDPWIPVVGRAHAAKHPLAMLIASLSGKATLDVDNFTFPTAAIMASWVWSETSRTAPLDISSMPNPKAVGSVLHFIQDLCVPHHARGWMSHGHASFEKRVGDIYERTDFAALLASSRDLVDPNHGPCTARSIVEAASVMSGGGLDLANPERACLVRAVGWTRAFVRRCVVAEL